MSILRNPALRDPQEQERSEEFSNFMQRVGEVSTLVKDLASGDKARASTAQLLADKYLNGKILCEEDAKLEIKSDRTVINHKAFRSMGKQDTGEMDKDAWMAEMSKDADRRALDKKIRRERAETCKTQAVKAFRRGEYDRALSCYNRAIEQIKDNPMFYCDRALTNIRLGNYAKVFPDCDLALRLNENRYYIFGQEMLRRIFKARLYRAKAHKELEEKEQLQECRKELDAMFPQHSDLTKYFLDKVEGQEEDEEENDQIGGL